MPQDAKQELQDAGIHVDHRWDLFNANALVESLLGRKPERWHLEKRSRRTQDLLQHPVTYTWILIHAQINGSWRFRFLPKDKAERLHALGITNTSANRRRNSGRLQIFMSPTST